MDGESFKHLLESVTPEKERNEGKEKRERIFSNFPSFPSFLAALIQMDPHLQLFNASQTNTVSEFKRLLEENLSLDINRANLNSRHRTPLHIATTQGSFEIVELLLAHPLIDVNAVERQGLTALAIACRMSRVKIVRLLCQDPRVEVNHTQNSFGYFPLYTAVIWKQFEAAQWLIALRGEDLDLEMKASYDGIKWTTTVEQAEKEKAHEMAWLLKKLRLNRAKTQFNLCIKLGWRTSCASELFAVMVFLCDGLLTIKKAGAARKSASGRFFTIVSSLPMELQMVLSHRVMGSMQENILSKDSEISFKKLAKVLGS